MKKHAIILNDRPDQVSYVFSHKNLKRISELTSLQSGIFSKNDLNNRDFQDVEIVFSTWGMPSLTEEELDMLPSLKAVFYAAGTIKGFAEPFLKRGIKVASAWKANAIPVAEFTLGQILLAANSYHLNIREYESQGFDKAFRGPGVYNIRCSLIGDGAIAMKLKELLEPFNIDTHIIPSREELRNISLEEVFENSFIVSNHLPGRDDNINTITGDMLRLLPLGATFINTGRGAQVNELELIDVMKERSDLTALLDVTEPEPVPVNSQLWKLPNVYLTSHIAGSQNNELERMVDYMLDDFIRWQNNKPMNNEVKLDEFYLLA